MKVRLVLVASLFMAMFAVVSPASAAPAFPIFSETTDLFPVTCCGGAPGQYPNGRGTATYKTYANGASSLEVIVQGLQILHGQRVAVDLNQPNGPTNAPVCYIRISAFGNGSCYVDTRLGGTLPVIITTPDHTGSFIGVYPLYCCTALQGRF